MQADDFQLPDLGPASDFSTDSAVKRFTACAKSGMLRFAVGEAFGGFGNRFTDLIAVHKRLGKQTRDPGLVLALNAHLWGMDSPYICTT